MIFIWIGHILFVNELHWFDNRNDESFGELLSIFTDLSFMNSEKEKDELIKVIRVLFYKGDYIFYNHCSVPLDNSLIFHCADTEKVTQIIKFANSFSWGWILLITLSPRICIVNLNEMVLEFCKDIQFSEEILHDLYCMSRLRQFERRWQDWTQN